MPDPTTQALLDAAMRGTLIALLLVLALVLRRDRPALGASRASAALCLGLCVQVVSSAPYFEAQVPRIWQAPFVAVSVGNSVVFWIVARALFDDEFAWRPGYTLAWLAVASMSALNCAYGANHPSMLWLSGAVLQRAAPAVFAALAALAASAHWQDDLVEDRRRLRGFIVVAGIAYTVAQLGARLGSPHGRLSGPAASLDVAFLLAIVAVVTVRLLRLTATELFPAASPAAASAPCLPVTSPPVPPGPPTVAPDTTAPGEPAEDPLAGALHSLMSDQRVYRAESLTVAALAARLGVPEYRLRRLINRRLGHRNFNAYINGFRLEDARTALADPGRKSQPVLTIALDAGFQSIGPFNRAFKAATGLTPTEFRRESLADS